jgi:hypothetical protein
MGSENNVPLDIDVLRKEYKMIYCALTRNIPSKNGESFGFYEPIETFEMFTSLWNMPDVCKTRTNSDGYIFLVGPRCAWIVNAQFVKRN